MTVDRQMKRYNVPCVAFINKLDRQGADPFRVTGALREKLGHNAVMVQIPIGTESDLNGIIDLVKMKAYYFDGAKGENMRETEIPADYKDKAEEYRMAMLDAVSMFSDDMMNLMLEEKPVPVDLIQSTIRKACVSRTLTPVFCGSAYKNKGVQLLLDGVRAYLPSPLDRQYFGTYNDKK